MPEFTIFQGEIALRLALAAVAGAFIGIERELRDQAAGLRTHMLVSVGACLFGLVSVYGFEAFGPAGGGVQTGVDLTRVASNIVTGVGFLGAGAIIRHGMSIRGLTTAASLWVVAALGTAISVGMYWAGGIAALITLISLWGLRIVRGKLRSAAGIDTETVDIRAESASALDDALDVLRERGYRVRDLKHEETDRGIRAHVVLDKLSPGEPIEAVIERLGAQEGITEIERVDG